MRTTWRREIPLWLLLLASIALAVWSWQAAPDQIPTRWSFEGEVLSHGSKNWLLLGPAVAVLIYVGLLVAPRIDPGRANYAQFAGTYYVLRLAITLALTALFGVFALAARGVIGDLGLVIGILVGLLLIVIGNFMGKIRPNFFVGIRTPWTLTSKRAWVKTHRLGGWVFIAFGVLILASGVLPGAIRFAPLGVLGAAVAIGLAIYSYLIWRTDPDRVEPAGTRPAG